MKKDWWTLLSALGWFCLFSACMLLLALSFIGCGEQPTRVSSIPDPFDGAEVVYFDDEYGSPALAIWKNGAVALERTVIEGYSCGPTLGFPPRESEVGPLVSVARAYRGLSFGYPGVGDTLGGEVILSTVIDTLTVTAGRFHVTMVAPDTLEGFAWLRVPSGVACHRDSMVRSFRLVRSRAEAL